MQNEITGEKATEEDFRSTEWLSIHAMKGKSVLSIDFSPLKNAGGLTSTMVKLIVKFTDKQQSFILKFLPFQNTSRSKELGLFREAFFYNHFGEKVTGIIPSISFAYGNALTGEKFILMNDLTSYTQSGYYFGACSPHNWRHDLEALTGTTEGDARRILTHKISLNAFEVAAKIHATFWNDKSITSNTWLRGVDWFKGEGEKLWLGHQKTASDSWCVLKSKIKDNTSKVNWNSHLLACMDASFAKVSWADFQKELFSPDYVFTLVHGDYHPANMMWKGEEVDHDGVVVKESLVLLDWEAVGLGSGPQDCAQYVISHMYPEERRLWEDELISSYYSVLIAGGVNTKDYSLNKCRADYVAGGVGRWVWLLALLTGMCPDSWVQFFHDQLLAFIIDHNITPDNIVMPRV
ncbi:hypothetical protein HK096_003352 [Nowakowskiella sp. JEL0078]|nr:hypothetical protein HK096_003352 [Nowakowskiella sp. JEL0078]